MTDPQQPDGSPDSGWRPPSPPAADPAAGASTSDSTWYLTQPVEPPPSSQQPGSLQPGSLQPGSLQSGYQQPAYGSSGFGQSVYRPARSTNGMAIAALVCSLAGLATCVSAPVGAILGHIARRQIQTSGEEGDGMALAGIIVGWVVTGLWVCLCGLYVAGFGLLAMIFGSSGGAAA